MANKNLLESVWGLAGYCLVCLKGHQRLGRSEGEAQVNIHGVILSLFHVKEQNGSHFVAHTRQDTLTEVLQTLSDNGNS